ncbi:hypothetical protein [Georgenia sp. AZ-5]|uniref:hypothetical protein n=1 Tax=Georgenia sp. AZ-5 TaxID=3367526 RepID=UPI0037545F7A
MATTPRRRRPAVLIAIGVAFLLAGALQLALNGADSGGRGTITAGVLAIGVGIALTRSRRGDH